LKKSSDITNRNKILALFHQNHSLKVLKKKLQFAILIHVLIFYESLNILSNTTDMSAGLVSPRVLITGVTSPPSSIWGK